MHLPASASIEPLLAQAQTAVGKFEDTAKRFELSCGCILATKGAGIGPPVVGSSDLPMESSQVIFCETISDEFARH